MVSKFLTALAASALVAAPIAANAQNASALSIAKSVRASAPQKASNKLAGGGIVFLLLAAAIVAGGVYIAVDDDNSDSN
ncbi:hypothetical protein ASG37_09715 [Sphingomonas sp. Leaf407]|uniref:hypothetical protein n=1 Tax=unclassified Sphingomonas TaxID=196159 RepID=UPI0006F42FFB|nr:MULTISPECIES: hypothetical protein [unclassified Sphingomonas]KQN37337.1 hypothetical protein ASE97_07005 [Sphingomonas sp. Leaf42]KQT27706.1 hypothetical protein ASG37_09715 [Sphingomonas sp. Leaf407]